METKEYIVSLKRDVDYDQFWNEIENESPDDGFVPTRRVDIVNNRDVSLRQCHYALTDQEAEKLRNDPRVYSVEEPTKFKPFAYAKQNSNFSKVSTDFGSYVNWGLKRCINETNIYGIGNTTDSEYTYCLDGTGVDVVIQDSGLQVDHPEFQDANGNSRVQQIDWFAESGVPGTMPGNHYVDTNGHGTHCAGIAAGKTFGWAKNAQVYSVKVDGLDGGEGGGLGVPDCFDVIIGWHNNKQPDPVTGVKRPTIVNMSWGYGDYFSNISGGNYQGTTWTGTSRRTDYGMVGANYGWAYRHGTRINYIDVSIQEMIDAGIHVCIAAGNSYQKVDVPAGTDYNNYYLGGYFNGAGNINYYHRGSSPYDDEAFMVGSIDSTVYNATTEYKSVFSESGPGVHIYAPGSNIMSATSNISDLGGSAPYYLDSNFYQTNISGTSMASPQVCGVGALLLQLEPKLTPAQLKAKVLSYCKSVIYSSGLNNDYSDTRSIKGSDNKFLYLPFNQDRSLSISALTLTVNGNQNP